MEGTRAVHAAYNSAALLAMAMLGSSACRTRNSERPYDPSTSSGKRASSSTKRPRSNLHTNGKSQTTQGPIRKRRECRGSTCWDAILTTVPIQAPSQRRTSQLTCRQKLQTRQPETQQQLFSHPFSKAGRSVLLRHAWAAAAAATTHSSSSMPKHLSKRSAGKSPPRFQKNETSVMGRRSLTLVCTEIHSKSEMFDIAEPS
jgi:hypothetical protein